MGSRKFLGGLSLFVIPLLTLSVYAAPIEVVDLASSTAWILNGGAVTVPGSNSVGSTSTYLRSITIPAGASDKVVKVLFGACNYGCEVYLGSTLITSHKNISLPFEADLTGKGVAGQTYTLEVRAHNSSYYGDKIPQSFGNVAWGIGRYVKLAVYPKVYIKDYFVRPSVKNDRLDVDVWVHNASPTSRSVALGATLSSWNNDPWPYPVIPQASAMVAPNSVSKITLSTAWGLGPDSYWWANIPFSEAYQATLHYLSIDLKEGATSLDTIKPRFGFVEYGEGPYYYTINGVRIGVQPSDGTPEPHYGTNGYSLSSSFTTRCAESFKRYMRLGVNTNRTHQSIPTVQMMNTADEIGFWLVPESAIRGFEQTGIWDSATYCDDVREMALACRNHPSVCRYSVLNEYNAANTQHDERLLIDAAYYGDPTRPLAIEGAIDGGQQLKMGLHTSAHAFNMEHYEEYRLQPLRRTLVGMGDYAYSTWAPQTPCAGTGNLMREADMGLEMRKRDWTYFAVWDFANYYPSMLTETSTSLAVDKLWFMKRCLNPYVVCDSAYDMANPCYSNPWPSTIPVLTEGAAASRRIYLFNDGFRGSTMKLVWELRWGSAAGTLAATGAVDTTVKPGFSLTVPVTFIVPATTATATPITVAGMTQVYKEIAYYFSVGGGNLYFVLTSYLAPPLKRFGARPGVLEFSGTGSLSGDISVSAVDGTLPQIVVQASPSWLGATVSGQANSQVIHVIANTDSLNPGIIPGTVTLTAQGYEPVICRVSVRVTGGSTVMITPTHTMILPSATAAFTAKLIDEVGTETPATFAWSASGGGSVNASGLFTSTGAAGVFEVTAGVQGQPTKTATARVVVTQGKPLPATVLTEMLVLHNPANTTTIPLTSTVGAIEGIVAGYGSDGPCHGRQLQADGVTYTWKTRSSSNGTFFSQTFSAGFASVTLLSPMARTIMISTTHYFAADIWRNGQKVAVFGGASPYGGVDQATISLQAGANVMALKQITASQGFFSIKFADQTGAALADVRYVIDTCGFESVAVQAPDVPVIPRALCLVRSDAANIVFSLSGRGHHRVELISAQGRVVRTFEGEGSKAYQISREQVGRGLYIVRAKGAAKNITQKLVVW